MDCEHPRRRVGVIEEAAVAIIMIHCVDITALPAEMPGQPPMAGFGPIVVTVREVGVGEVGQFKRNNSSGNVVLGQEPGMVLSSS